MIFQKFLKRLNKKIIKPELMILKMKNKLIKIREILIVRCHLEGPFNNTEDQNKTKTSSTRLWFKIRVKLKELFLKVIQVQAVKLMRLKIFNNWKLAFLKMLFVIALEWQSGYKDIISNYTLTVFLYKTMSS